MKILFILFITMFSQIHTNAQSLYFPPLTGNTWDTISPLSLGYCQDKIDSLYTFLDSSATKAFILLKDGKIVLEKYFGTHTQNSLWYWASAGKTITAFLVGIAQQEGYLYISDTTSKYLGYGWTSCSTEQEEKITIWHQLTMTTGLDDNVSDPFCTIDTCLIYKADAGSRWAYHNAPYTLLDKVIENSTGNTLNNYATQKLKNLTGMTGSFVSIGFNNIFFSNARSMARFGLLILNKGNWNGNQILSDTNYFNQMVNTSQELNKSYGYLWWLNGKESFMVPYSQYVFTGNFSPNAPSDMIAAIGKDGQFLSIVPSQNLVWLRMGNSPNNVPVDFLLIDYIWYYINNLTCNSATISNNTNYLVELYPNPTNDFLNVKANTLFSIIEIYNSQGRIIDKIYTETKEKNISISEFSNGIYFIKILFLNGNQWSGKFIKK